MENMNISLRMRNRRIKLLHIVTHREDWGVASREFIWLNKHGKFYKENDTTLSPLYYYEFFMNEFYTSQMKPKLLEVLQILFWKRKKPTRLFSLPYYKPQTTIWYGRNLYILLPNRTIKHVFQKYNKVTETISIVTIDEFIRSNAGSTLSYKENKIYSVFEIFIELQKRKIELETKKRTRQVKLDRIN